MIFAKVAVDLILAYMATEGLCTVANHFFRPKVTEQAVEAPSPPPGFVIVRMPYDWQVDG